MLFAIKAQLVEGWGFTRSTLWVDEQEKTLSWNSDLVIGASVEGSLLQVRFGETWEDFLAEGDLLSILQTARDRLESAFVARGKGKGKGKSTYYMGATSRFWGISNDDY